MEFEFANRHLEDLYTKGHSKKFKLPKGMERIYIERINRIEAAFTINDLRNPQSMKFKKLESGKNRFSIRLNIQFRLEFEIEFEDKAKTKGKVIIKNVSNHYE